MAQTKSKSNVDQAGDLAIELFLFGTREFEDCTVDQLVNLAMVAKDAYENSGTTLMEDNQYDQLERYIQLAHPEDDVTEIVGSKVRGQAVSLPFVMPGLIQVHEGELNKWTRTHPIATSYALTDKLDGNSVELIYDKNGKFTAAFTRGDVVEGKDITRHLLQVTNFPKQLSKGARIQAVRAEIILPRDDFENVNTIAKRAQPYKNPRNMVAGLMNATESDPKVLERLSVVAYEILDNPTMHKATQLSILSIEQFEIPSLLLIAEEPDDQFLAEYLNTRRKQSRYELDGIVIDINEEETRKQLTRPSDKLEPGYARKYKVADASNMAIATVKNVHWAVSKTAYLKPRIEIEPVELVGVTVTYATGFNAKFVHSNKIGPGAKIQITRSGDVIPFVTRTVEPSTIVDYQQWFKGELSKYGTWEWTETLVDVYLTSDHPDIAIEKAISFFTAVDVDGLREGNIRKLFDVQIDSVAEIIKCGWDVMVSTLGENGKKIHDQINEKLNPIDLPLLMGASGLFGRGIGTRKLRKLWEKSQGDRSIFTDYQRIVNTEGFSDTTAAAVFKGYPLYLEFEKEVGNYIAIGKYIGANSDGELSGQIFVFTGFRDADLKKKVEDCGGTLADAFSSKTTCVVAKDPSDTSGKLKKAREKGIRIISITDLEKLLE